MTADCHPTCRLCGRPEHGSVACSFVAVQDDSGLRHHGPLDCVPAHDPRDAQIARLTAENADLARRLAEAEAIALAVKGTIDEAGIGVLPVNIVIGRIRDGATGEEQDWAIRPNQLLGLWYHLRKKCDEMIPWGQRCVEDASRYPDAHARAETAEARLRLAEGLAEAAKAYRAWQGRFNEPDADLFGHDQYTGYVTAECNLDAALAAWEGTDGTRG